MPTCSSASTPKATTSGTRRRASNQTFENIYALPRLHALFARHGVRPTYVITYPVATDPRSADVLRAAAAPAATAKSARTTTPGRRRRARPTTCGGTRTPRRCRAAQFEAQLASLTEAIAAAVGTRPVSYRSGRFGFSADHVSSLEQQGYLVDSSVAPLFYEAHKGGPDFVDAPLTPYFLAYDSATRPGSSNLLEVPVERRAQPVAAPAARSTPTRVRRGRTRPSACCASLGLAAPALAAAVLLVARRHDRARPRPGARASEPVLNLLFHSSEAIVGGSPYNRTEGELDAFFDRLERFLAFAIKETRRQAGRPSRSSADAYCA